MTIREVLNADWTVDRVDITVRDRETTKYIMRYCIGRDVMPGKYDKFVYEAEAGTVYSDCKKRILFINRIIQFRQLEEKPRGDRSYVPLSLWMVRWNAWLLFYMLCEILEWNQRGK